MRITTKRSGDDILRSYVRTLLEGAVPDDAASGEQEQIKEPSAAALDSGDVRQRIVDAIGFSNRLDSSILRAFQADVNVPFVDNGPSQVTIEQNVTNLISEAANWDAANYPEQFPLCTAVVLCAIDTGDLQNGPALLRDIYEGIKTIGESRKNILGPVLKESVFGEVSETYLKKVVSDVIESLAKKKLIKIATEIEINKFVKDLAAGALKLPAGAALSGTETEAKQVIKSLIFESVKLAEIKGAVKDLTAIEKVAQRIAMDEPSLTSAASELSFFKKQSKYFVPAQGGGQLSVTEPIDDVLNSFNRMQPSQQQDIVEEAGLGSVQEFRQAVADVKGDVDSLAQFVDSTLSRPDVIKSIIGTGSRQASQLARKAASFAWDAIKGTLSTGKQAFFPQGSGAKWMKVLAYSTSAGTMWQLVFKDPQLRRDYRMHLKLADALVEGPYKQWADSADFDEIADEMETLFDPQNSSLDNAITIVRVFDQKRGTTTGSDVTVAEG